MFTRDDYLRQFRADNPTLNSWSDEDILDQYGQQFADDPNHPYLAQRAQEQKDAANPISSLPGYTVDAVKAGIDQGQAKLYGATALAGDILGSDRLKEWGDEGYVRNMAEANEEYHPLVENFKDVKNAKDLTFWIAGLTGTALPQIVGTAAAAALAGAAAPEEAVGAGAAGVYGLGVRALQLLGAGAAEDAAAGLSTKALAGLAGTFIAGATQSQSYEELKAEGGDNAASLGALNGLLGGLLQTQGPAASLSKLFGDGITHSAITKAAVSFFDKVPAPLVRVAITAAHEGSKNMLFSMAQESAALLSEAYSNRNNPDHAIDDQTVRNRMTNAAVSGFMLGGVTGAAMGRFAHGESPVIAGESPVAEPTATPTLASLDQPLSPISEVERARAAALTPDLSRFAESAPTEATSPLAPTQATPQPELASPASQQVLVHLGMKPEQAMTIPESEARVLIDQARKQAEAKQVVDTQQADADRQAQIQQATAQQAEQQRQLQIAKQQADARAQLAAAQPEPTQSIAPTPSVQDRVRQLRSQQAAARDFTNTEKLQVKTGGIVSALREQPTEAVPVAAQPGPKIYDLINQAKANAEQAGSETMRPVDVQKIKAPVAEPVLPNGSEPAAPVTEPPHLPTSDVTNPRQLSTNAEDSSQPPINTNVDSTPSHGLPDISNFPVKQFLAADETPSRKAAAQGNTRAPTERYSVFERPDGQIEVRHVTPGAPGDDAGRVAVRENQAATPDTIAAAVNTNLGEPGKISVSMVRKLLSGEKGRFSEEVRNEATRQGYTEKGNRIDPIELEKPVAEGGKEYKFLGTIVADKGQLMKHVQVLSKEAFAEKLSRKEVAPESTDNRPTIPANQPIASVASPHPVEARVPAQVEVAPSDERITKLLDGPNGVERVEGLVRGLPELTHPRVAKLLNQLLLSPEQQERFAQMTKPEQKAVVDLTRARLKEKLAEFAAHENPVPEGNALDQMTNAPERPLKSTKTFERRPTSDDYRVSDDHAAARFSAGVIEAAGRGVTLNLREATAALKEGGLYDPSKNEVHLTMKNVAAPTRQDFISLAHEVIHSQTEGQPEWLRLALQDTFARLPIGEKAFYGNTEADPRLQTGKNIGNLSRETYLLEQAVEHAALHGVDREYSKGVISAVWRTIKDYLLKGAVYLQGKMFGPENAGGTLAKQWVENASAQFLAGDHTAIDSFLEKIGKKATFAQIRTYTSAGERVLVNYIDPRTGAPRVDFNHDMSEAGAFYRAGAHIDSAKVELVHSGLQAKVEAEVELRELYKDNEALLRTVPDSRPERDKVLTNALKNTISEKRIAVAVANQLHSLYARLFDRASNLFPEQERAAILKARAAGESVADSLTFKQWLADHGLRNMQDQADIELKTLEARLADEGEKMDVTKLVHPDVKIDDLGTGERVKADEAFLKEATRVRDRVQRMLALAETKITRLRDTTETRRATIQTVTKTLRDFQATERFAIRDIVANLDGLLRKELPATERLSETAGYTRAIIESLGEQEAKTFDTKFTQRIIDSLDIPTLPLASIFKGLFALESSNGFSLADAKPSAVRDAVVNEVKSNPASELTRLLTIGEGENASIRGTALLSAILGFVKKEAGLVDTIRLQLGEAKTRDAHVNAVREALAETHEATIKEIQDRAKTDLKSPANRTIFSLLKERDQALKDQKTLAQAERASELLRVTKDAVHASVQAAEQRIDVSNNWALKPGGKIFNPSSPEQASSEVIANQATLDLSREKALSHDQLVEIRHNQQEWLDARRDKVDQQDITYRTMLLQHDRLTEALIPHTNKMLSGLKNGWMHNIAEQMDRTGTHGGRLIHRMAVGLETATRGEATKNTLLGKKAETTKQAFYRAAKVRPEWEKTNMLDEAVYLLKHAQGADRFEGYERVRRAFLKNEDTKPFASDPKIWALYEARLDAYAENNLQRTKTSVKYGNRVRDEKITRVNPATGENEAALRAHIEQGVPGFTAPTFLDGDLKAKLATWNNTFAVLDQGAANNPFTDAQLLLRQNPDALRAKLQTALGESDFKQLVMDPLVADTESPNMPAPERPDGLKLPVPGDLSAEAWQAANGDLLEYSKQVMQRLGTDGTPEGLLAYQTKVLRHVETSIRKLAQRAGLETASDSQQSLIGIPHIGIDAMIADDFKRQWVSFGDFSVEDNRSAMHSILTHAFFGRDLRELKNAAVQVEQDLTSLAQRMPETREEREALKRRIGTSKFEEIQTAVDQSHKWTETSILKAFSGEIDPSKGATGDMGPALEIYGTVVQGLLFGARTALKDLAALAHPFQLERSLSLQTAGRTAKAHGYLVKYGMATMMNAFFGTDLLRNDWKIQLQEKYTGGDIARSTTLSDWMSGTYGKNNAFEKSAYGKAQRALRLFRNTVANGRLGFNKDASGAALRINLFGTATQLEIQSGVSTYMDATISLAQKTAEFYRQNPDRIGKLVTAKDIGYGDIHGFNVLKNTMGDYGVSLESLGERLAKKPDMRPEDLLQERDVQGINSMVMGRILGEGGPDSRPTFGRGSKFARLNSSLIGWSFWKTAELTNMLRDEKGRTNLRALANGAAAMGLGLLPAGVAASLLLDQYDEKLLKKKSNLRSYHEGMSAEDAVKGTMERMVAMGSFGLPGEVLNGVFNATDGSGQRALSVDQRIVWVNSALQLYKAIGDLSAVGGLENANYANIGRPIASALGFGGIMQNIQLFNGLFGAPDLPVFRDEANVTARINVNNWLRSAGRELQMDVGKGSATATPNATTPWITDMVLVALSNDPAEFQKSYKGAVLAAQSIPGVSDPMAYVKQHFGSRNPLKTIFRTTPSEDDVRRLLSVMPEEGRTATTQAMGLMNAYGARLGVTPYFGASGARSNDVLKMQAQALHLPQGSASIAAIRDAAAARRGSDDY